MGNIRSRLVWRTRREGKEDLPQFQTSSLHTLCRDTRSERLVLRRQVVKIAVVGSREYQHLDHVRRFVREEMHRGDILISGGALGVDQAAESEAIKRGIQLMIFHPDYGRYPRNATLVRNQEIAEACDLLIAFWDGISTGTSHAVRCARRLNKPVTVVRETDYEFAQRILNRENEP